MITHEITKCGLMKEKHSFIMMIQEKWWREFCRHNHDGRKVHSYVQKGLAPPKEASLIFFYVTKPSREIAGYGEFIERKIGDAKGVWEEYGGECVLDSKVKYLEFLGGVQKASFIRFENLREAEQPISLNNILMLLGKKRLSRKGFYVNKEIADKLLTLLT
jgi:predicted transcriptional regulator